MATSNTTLRAPKMYGNGSQTKFYTGLSTLASDELTVYVDETLQVLDTDYTVETGDRSTVVFTEAPAANTIISIFYTLPLTQTVDLDNDSTVTASTIGEMLDKISRIQIKQAADIEYLFKIPVTQTAVTNNITLPTPSANKYLRYATVSTIENADNTYGDNMTNTTVTVSGTFQIGGSGTINGTAILSSAVFNNYIRFNSQTPLAFYNGSFYTAFKAPSSVPTNYTITIPATTPSVNDYFSPSGIWVSSTGSDVEYINTYTASGANLDIPLSSTYKVIEVYVSGAAWATSLNIRTSSDNGSTFDSGASDYDTALVNGGASVTAATTSQGRVQTAASGTSTVETFKVTIIDPGTANCIILSDYWSRQGYTKRVTGSPNYLRIYAGSGSLTVDKCYVYGLK